MNPYQVQGIIYEFRKLGVVAHDRGGASQEALGECTRDFDIDNSHSASQPRCGRCYGACDSNY